MRTLFGARFLLVTVWTCAAALPASGQELVSIVPVVRSMPTPPGSQRQPAPPASAPRVDAGSPFYVELWASNIDAPLVGIACAHVDLNYDDTGRIDPGGAVDQGVWFPVDAVGATFNDATGDIRGLGGCQMVPETLGLGVLEWVMVQRVQLLAVDNGAVQITLAPSVLPLATTRLIGMPTLTPGQVDVGAVSFGVGDCAGHFECNDGVPCTVDTCDLATFTCTFTPDPVPCSNGVFCDGAEVCMPGVGCLPGVPTDCDDGVTCTIDVCDEGQATCVHLPDPGVCDDGAFCNGAEVCDVADGCRAGLPVDCDDGVACTVDGCDELNDTCVHGPDHAACDDGAFCNGSEVCDASSGCLAGPPIDCNDGVACTVDGCNETNDTCVHGPDDGACDDGLFCNGAETCAGPDGCAAGVAPCAGQICLEGSDTCVDCTADAHCDDGLSCNGTETCVDGACAAGTPVACNDGLLCTIDTCDEALDVCAFTPVDCTRRGTVCDPADGQCKDCFLNSHCDDGVACTINTCDTDLGQCTFPPSDAACDDGAFCNGPEGCDAVLGCQSGSAPCAGQLCNETTDACVDCLSAADCDDGLYCNGVETCENGSCINGTAIDCGDGVACTLDTCNETTDSCASAPSHAACDDGLFCNGSESCDAELGCLAGSTPCPGQACIEATDSCVDCVADAECSDGLFCNGVEQCVSGVCVAGSAVDCNDGVACTADVCREDIAACVHTPDHGLCDNGLFCDGVETCHAVNGCIAGAAIDCTDTLPCTADSCDEAADACVHDDSACPVIDPIVDHFVPGRFPLLPAVTKPERAPGDHITGTAPQPADTAVAGKRGGQRFAAGVTCPINDPAQCQAPDRLPHGVSGTVAATSDTNPNAGFIAADTFTATADGTLTGACWTGLYVDWQGPADCATLPANDAFTITYYADDAGGAWPGTPLASFGVGDGLRFPTGNVVPTAIGAFTEYQYFAAHPALAVTAGSCYWIEIRNATTGSCFWMWQTAPAGDLISAQTASSGTPYAAGDERDYDLAFCLDVDLTPTACGTDCLFACDGSETAEGETNCAQDYADTTNGGCNSAPPAWTALTCPSGPICGTAGTYLGFLDCTVDLDCPPGETCAGGTCTGGRVAKRDTDWYQFTLTTPTTVTWTVTADFEATIGLINDDGGTCAVERFVKSAQIPPCQEVSISRCLAAGTWSAFVAPARVTDAVDCASEYTAELTCSGTACPVPQEVCGSLSGSGCQLPNHEGNGVDNALGATSDDAAGFAVSDNFTANGTGTIDSVCWWGFYLDIGGTFADCGPGTGDDFVVTYYTNDGTLPGAVLAGPYTLGSVTRSPTGKILNQGPQPLLEYGYTAAHPPVAVQDGACYWIEIRNRTTPDDQCIWLWSSAPAAPLGDGDLLSAQDLDGMGYAEGEERGLDLAWCVSGSIGGVTPGGCQQTGACCAFESGQCIDGQATSTCLFKHNGRITPDTLCTHLDPPCKTAGCCMPDGSCVNMLTEDCPGTALAGLLCSSRVCNAYGSCAWDNGVGNPFSVAPASQYAAASFFAESSDEFFLLGDGVDPCEMQNLTWWVRHFNTDGGGCNAGLCSLSSAACDITDPAACSGGVEGTCNQSSTCSGTPDDYASIRVTVYADAFETGVVDEIIEATCNQFVPQGPFGAAACATTADCNAGEVCMDNNGDGTTECAAACDIVISGSGDTLTDLDIGLVLEHTWQGDVVVSLEHVGFGPPVRLLNRPGMSTLHGTGFGPDGYQADHFGDPDLITSALVLNDDGRTPINIYDGSAGGVFKYKGPAISGGGGDPSAVLTGFTGQPKDGTWRLTVSDHAGGLDNGTLVQWSLRSNTVSPVPTGPKGTPEHTLAAFACGVDGDCIAAGCAAGTVCSSGFCNDGGAPCGTLQPTGSHLGDVVYELDVLPGDYTWSPYFDEGYRIDIDLGRLGVLLEQNRAYYLAVAPVVPFDGFYQTAWMKSLYHTPDEAQRIFETLSVYPWQLVANGPADLGFRLTGLSQTGCPSGSAAECCDLDGNNATDDVCTWCACTPPCVVQATTLPADMGGPFGACPPDGFCNIHDRNLALACFASVTTCAAINIDAGGAFGSCTPDGFCNVHDANHALACFAGVNTCSCGPAPAAPPPPAVDTGRLALRASRRTLRPGGTVQVRTVLTTPLANLQSYQLHVDASGGSSGSLELIDVAIEARQDFVFHAGAGAFDAVNVATAQMIAGVDSGRPTAAGAYLATFTFRASADADGAFVVDLRHDAGAPNDQTFLVAGGQGRIAIDRVDPATVTVTPSPRISPRR